MTLPARPTDPAAATSPTEPTPSGSAAPSPTVPTAIPTFGRQAPDPSLPPRMELQDVAVRYGEKLAVRDTSLRIPGQAVTALIGPSGCGKSTVLRCLNRMNDLIPGAKVEGRVTLDGEDIYAEGVDAVEVRRRIGLIFQKPNPFPMTIYDNVAYGPRRRGLKDKARLDETVEQCLRRAALWDEVSSDFRKKSGLSLSGGQQQRLCIARALATEPEVLLMDEPASALDPISTLRIEELMEQLRQTYTIVIVTHNMQQAARVSDYTAFFSLGEDRVGYLVEVDETTRVFTNPRERLTEDYVSGRFG